MKKALMVEEQVQTLKDRGMYFKDEEEAKKILLDVGYYRLGFYTFPFEETFPNTNKRDHKLREGTMFEYVVELYNFDCELRMLLIYFLNRIEVNVRTQITYIVSTHYVQNPTWFVDKNIMSDEYVDVFDSTVYSNMKKNLILSHHHKKHKNGKYAPAWKTLEFMTLGNVIHLYSAIKDKKIKEEIGKRYNCNSDTFQKYMKTINLLRNRCVHGNCLFNINLSKSITLLPADVPVKNRQNIAGAIKVVIYMMRQISTECSNDLIRNLHKLLHKKHSQNTKKIIESCTGLVKMVDEDYKNLRKIKI